MKAGSRNGWKNSKGQPVENQDLVEKRLSGVMENHEVAISRSKVTATMNGIIAVMNWRDGDQSVARKDRALILSDSD